MSTTPKRPRDANELAKHVIDIATGQAEDSLATAARTRPLSRWAGVVV